MSYWGKMIGGMAGLVMGGPFGAVMGAALGHAADEGVISRMRLPGGMGMNPARIAAMLGGREQLFAIAVVVLSAKLAKCDGPVVRLEIDAFKRQFRIPPGNVRDVGRLFDQARDSTEGFESYARQLGDTFTDTRGVLEDVMAALFAIARADSPVNGRELDFLQRVHSAFGLDTKAWDRARGAAPRFRPEPTDDAYGVLGVARTATDDQVRKAWKDLVRANHPDSLADAGRAGGVRGQRHGQGRRDQRGLGPRQAGTRPLIRQAPSPNQDDRPPGVPIDMLVLHYTGMRSASGDRAPARP